MDPWGLAFVAAGLFTAICGIGNWDWFMNHRKAQLMCSFFGRTGARIFYIIVGLAFTIFGVLFAMGVIPDKK